MANFEVTYRDNSEAHEVKSVIFTAPDERAAGKAFTSSHPDISPNAVIAIENLDIYQPKYGAANFVCSLISFGGWILLILGVVGVVAGVFFGVHLIADAQRGGFDPSRPMFIAVALGGAGFSLLFAIIGLVMAAIGQHLRATTDAANSVGELLVFMKSAKT